MPTGHQHSWLVVAIAIRVTLFSSSHHPYRHEASSLCCVCVRVARLNCRNGYSIVGCQPRHFYFCCGLGWTVFMVIRLKEETSFFSQDLQFLDVGRPLRG